MPTSRQAPRFPPDAVLVPATLLDRLLADTGLTPDQPGDILETIQRIGYRFPPVHPVELIEVHS